MHSQTRLPKLDRLVVTRPLNEAEHWARALSQSGWPAEMLPLISIGPPTQERDRLALHETQSNWGEWDALMFVSTAAVSGFWGGDCPQAPPACKTRFWAPGPGTARALGAALNRIGLTPEQIDAPPADAQQFDSEALWPVVQSQLAEGKKVLVVRGTSSEAPLGIETSSQPGQGRDWLIRLCESAGAQVQACVAYARQPPAWTDPMREQALRAAQPGSVWLLSSSEALAYLRMEFPATSWAEASALVTHPRIAAAARALGFREVHETRPSMPDVLRALESHWSPI